MHQAFDIEFLKKLKQKLTTGNLRSIYLNALPRRYLTRLDLADINSLGDGLSNDFLEMLMGRSNFEFKLNLDSEKARSEEEVKKMQATLRRLSSITIENNDHYSEHGVKTFGFGYPIILRRDEKDPKRIIKAPLIIWSLDIERNILAENEWIIRRSDDFSVMTNIVLTSHILNDAGLQLVPIYDQLLEDDILDKQELAQLIYLQNRQLDPTLDSNIKNTFVQLMNSPIRPLPDHKFVSELPLKKPQVLWSGVFGLFRSQKDSVIKDLDNFILNFDQIKKTIPKPNGQQASSFMKHAFTMVNTDPSQQHLLHSLGRGHNLIVQGPPGTGKSQTLTGIITNVISNGGRCLVVCEKKTALDVIQQNLKDLGLDKLSVIIEDIYRDRTAVVNSVRDRSQRPNPPYKPSPSFIRVLQSCAMQIQRLQKFHHKLVEPISGDNSWSDVVGKFLQSDVDPLTNQHFNARDFQFTVEELDDILRNIQEGEPLYKKLGTLNHPFNVLNERFFKSPNVHHVQNEVTKAIKALLHAVDSAKDNILAYLYQYEKLLENHYNEVFRQLSGRADLTLDRIEEGFSQSKYYFNKSGGVGRKFLELLSFKYQDLRKEKAEVFKEIDGLRTNHAQFNYFKHEFVDLQKKDLTFEEVQGDLKAYREKLAEWYSNIDPVMQQYVNQLAVNNVHPHADFRKQAVELHRNLDLLEKNFAKSQLFKVGFRFSSTNIRKRLTDLEGLHDNVKKVNEKIQEFRDYHALKFFWASLSPAQRSAFQGLAAFDPKDWSTTFSNWYFSSLLARHADEYVPKEDRYRNVVNGLSRDLVDLRKMLKTHILRYWRSRQTDSIKTFLQTKSPLKIHSLYNKRGNSRARRNPLRKIIETDPALFTSFFPVLLVSPSVCSSILPLQPDLFDVVIFDEASQLRLEDTFTALVRGKYKIVSGDSQQMPPADYFQAAQNLIHEEEGDYLMDDEEDNLENVAFMNESLDYLSGSESLLEYSVTEGSYKEDFLQVHYRSKHPMLIDFSNAAFYGNRLSPMPADKDYNAIRFFEVDGLYQNGVNQTEVAKVIELLLKIVDNKAAKDKLPTVGVATFNLHQRNLILEEIQRVAAHDEESGAKLQRLLSESRLFVKNLENIQGDERDVLIISTTFGKREDGSFIQNFGPLNKDRGYRLLNVIITRAKEQIYLVTSIPANYYEQYQTEIQRKGNSGKAIFYAYLNYAKAASNNDDASREAILQLLYENCENKPMQLHQFVHKENLFEQQVVDFLDGHLMEYQLERNYKYAGFKIPLVVKDQSAQPLVAIFFDVYTEQPSEEAYAWDIFNEHHLSRFGFACLRVWSYAWWLDEKKEKNRLLRFIKGKVAL